MLVKGACWSAGLASGQGWEPAVDDLMIDKVIYLWHHRAFEIGSASERLATFCPHQPIGSGHVRRQDAT